MRHRTLFFLLLLALAGCVSPAQADCKVQRIVDGDTLVCDGGDRIRLLLIDAPELSQGPFGTAARRELESLAPVGTALRLEMDVQPRDRYGRTLAYLWLEDGRMVNEELLRAGVAVVAVYPPNVRHVDRLRAAVEEAREGKVGLWATSAFECEPGDHRAGRC
jgi:micrococcal nuclease